MANSEERGRQLKRVLERIADSFLEISDEEISKQDIEAWGTAEEAEHVRAILRSAVEVGRDSAPQGERVELNDTLAHATAGQGEMGKELTERATQSKSMAAESQDQPLIDVLIGENSPIHAKLLGDALSLDRGLRVIGATAGSREFLELAGHCTPHVAILSETLGETNLGTATLRQFHASYPQVPVIILLESYKREAVVEAFRSGARGIFTRQESVANLCKCVRAVHEGQIWANSREVRFPLEVLTSALPIRSVSAAGLNVLSKREQEVAQHAAQGLSNRQIASRMNLSEHTVKNYLFRIFEKLGVSNRMELLFTLQPSAGHPAGTDRKENSVRRGIAVAILTEHREQQLPIHNRVEATGVARIVFSHPAFPQSATDSIIRQIQDQHAEVVIVDLHPENLQRTLDAIELIQSTTSDIAIFAIGEMSIPMNIVAAMRAGACEYVDRQAGDEIWLDAFARFAARTKKHVCKRDGIDGTGGESAPPAVPVLSPRSGGPLTLPPKKATWET